MSVFSALKRRLIATGFVFATVISLTQSCSDSNPNPTPATPPCLLSRIVDEFAPTDPAFGYQVNTIFEYDADYRLIQCTTEFASPSSSYTNVTTYTYQDGLIVSSLSSIGPTTATWTYDGRRVKRITSSMGTFDFSYGSRGKLTSWTSTIGSVVTTYTLAYNTSDNLIQSVKSGPGVTSGPGTSVTTTYDGFDTRLNPYSIAAGAMNQTFYVDTGNQADDRYVSQNNFTGATVTGTMMDTYSYSYIYALNYPVKIIRTQNDASLTTTLQYQNCQ